MKDLYRNFKFWHHIFYSIATNIKSKRSVIKGFVERFIFEESTKILAEEAVEEDDVVEVTEEAATEVTENIISMIIDRSEGNLRSDENKDEWVKYCIFFNSVYSCVFNTVS